MHLILQFREKGVNLQRRKDNEEMINIYEKLGNYWAFRVQNKVIEKQKIKEDKI